MKTKTMLATMAMGIAITFFGCKGDTGATGPAGADGSANVYLTEIIVTPGQWNSNDDNAFYYQQTVALADVGSAVLMYIYTTNASGEDVWTELPADNFSGSFANDQIEFDYASLESPATNVSFDVIVVPQPMVAKMKLHGVDMKDYTQVQEFIKSNNSK